MEKYLNILNEELLKNDKLIKIVDEENLKMYFEIIEELNFEEVITNSNKFNDMISKFEEKYDFKKYMAIDNNAQRNILSNLIQSIKTTATNDRSKLKLLMPLIVYLDFENILSNNIFIEKENIKEIKIFCIEFLRDFHINIDIPNNIPYYDSEARMVEKYKNNFDSLNFENIYELVDSIERSGKTIHSPFLKFCSHIIINNCREDYLKILNEKKDVLEIKLLIERLSDTEKVKMGVETSNFLVKFEVIRELVYFSTREIEDKLILEISKIITAFTSNNILWKQFIMYYLAYPSRSPKFFISLGIALKKISKENIKTLLQEIKINKYINNESITAINNCFSKDNLENLTKDSLEIIYERWIQYIEDEESMNIIITDVIDIVIFYIVNIMKEDKFEHLYSSCIRYIKEINNIWFQNKSDQYQFYYKKVSILFALGFRLNFKQRNEIIENFKTSIFIKDEDLRLIESNWSQLDI